MFPFPVIPKYTQSFPLLTCDAASFDGLNDYATRGAGLTGAVDSKKFTLVLWTPLSGSGPMAFLTGATTVGGATLNFSVKENVSDKFEIIANNAAGVEILKIRTTSSMTAWGGWSVLLCSVDLSDTGKRHLYRYDNNELVVTTYTDDTIDFTLADWAVAALPDGTSKYGDDGLAEIMFWPGVYIDLSQSSNRKMFFSATGKPSDPSATGGAIATLGAPAIYFHLDNAETANNFVANDDGGATGGAFTVTGALTTYEPSPSD